MDSLLGIPIGVPSLRDAVQEALAAIESRERQIVFACANSHSMNVAESDDTFRQALLNADQLVADGVGVSIIARLAGKDVGPRIIGHEYFEALLAALKARGRGRVFFFGSSDLVLRRINERFRRDYPESTLCGSISPPFGEWSSAKNDEFLDCINEAQPDVLWVGMTAPKQEKWVYQNRSRLSVPVLASIGAVFDFYAGTVKPCPRWIRKIGLESVVRLAAEPRRMWKRAAISSANFIRVGLTREVLRRRDAEGPSGR